MVMYIEQMYTNCLAEAAYYVESKGEAVIIDPMREVDDYLNKAKSRNAKIKYIVETHFHADFVSGHLDLAKKTGAKIVYGPKAETAFEAYHAKDGEVLSFGNASLKVLHTPGHTLESSCFLLSDETGKEKALFTGDTLFIGDVGRPDLAIDVELSREDLAGMLYDSLHNKIAPLGDDVMIYPAHGAGSACGKNISKETYSTLGEQKKTNYAFNTASKDYFIKEVTTGIMPAPQYFEKNALLNQQGAKSVDEALKDFSAVDAGEVQKQMDNGAVVLDTRSVEDFRKGHIPDSIFIGIDGQFAVWAGTLIPELDTAIVLIADDGREREAAIRLARVGFDNCIGFLKGGVEAWKESGRDLKTLKNINAVEYTGTESGQQLLDVRKPGEFFAGHVQNAVSLPLDFINDRIDELAPEQEYYVHCKSGYRSVVASSILMRHGIDKLINIDGGFDALSKQELPLETSSHPH